MIGDREIIERLKKIRTDPLEFLKCVRTLDQVDKVTPIKKFPVHLDYLQIYSKLWVAEPLIAVPKSRRMKMSWVNICLYLWDTLFNIGRHQAFVSKKEEDSDDLVKRARFVYENLDPELLPKELLPKVKYSENLLEFPELESRIQGFPSGSDQLRQFTFSGMLFDEWAFWKDAQRAYSSSVPTIEGGGRITGISSVAPGFFQKVVFDRIDEGQVSGVEATMLSDEKPTKRLFPMQGVEIWKNPKNRFCVIEIHYTADPAKRSAEFKSRVKASLPHRDFMREYEISWETWQGLPVYADWDSNVHGVPGEIKPHLGLPLLRGWDFGLTPACVVCQVQEEQLVVIEEYVAFNMGVDRFSDWVLTNCRQKYPLWNDSKKDFLDYIDPSGFARKDTDEKSCADILTSKGIRCIAGAITWTKRREAVEHFLTRRTKQGPALLVSLPKAPTLVRGFKGGYYYPEDMKDAEANELRPEKNEYSHVHDAFQMVASGIRTMRKRSGRAIPIPSYHSKQ